MTEEWLLLPDPRFVLSDFIVFIESIKHVSVEFETGAEAHTERKNQHCILGDAARTSKTQIFFDSNRRMCQLVTSCTSPKKAAWPLSHAAVRGPWRPSMPTA